MGRPLRFADRPPRRRLTEAGLQRVLEGRSAVRDSGPVEQFALAASPGPDIELDPRLVVGQPITTGSRRVLLAGVALPMPPSQNQYWRSRVVKVKATGRDMAIIYTTHEAKNYRQRIAELLLEQGAWYRSANPLLVDRKSTRLNSSHLVISNA